MSGISSSLPTKGIPVATGMLLTALSVIGVALWRSEPLPLQEAVSVDSIDAVAVICLEGCSDTFNIDVDSVASGSIVDPIKLALDSVAEYIISKLDTIEHGVAISTGFNRICYAGQVVIDSIAHYPPRYPYRIHSYGVFGTYEQRGWLGYGSNTTELPDTVDWGTITQSSLPYKFNFATGIVGRSVGKYRLAATGIDTAQVRYISSRFHPTAEAQLHVLGGVECVEDEGQRRYFGQFREPFS